MSELNKDIQSMLSKGEQILLISKQSRFKPGGSKFTPNTIYVTNQRIIFRNPRLLARARYYGEVTDS